MGDKQARSHGKYTDTGSISVPTKQTSMCSSIIWNISKALEKNPNMDLTRALRVAHEQLDDESRDESEMISQTPERYLTCALLAWHKLGHTDVDGLCKFIEENRIKPVCSTSENLASKNNIENANKADVTTRPIIKDHKRSENIKDVDSTIFDTCSLMGPVVKLPVETKIVMRFTSPPPCQHHLKKPQKNKSDVKNKIDAACCMDSACIQRLSELDQAVNDLRNRAVQLARREAERVELLERAEAGWKDLELGYQRRLMLAEEKEDDMAKQIKKSIEERNSYKNVCTNLAELLKQRGATAEKERERLKTLEKDVCDRACLRMRLSEESGKGDAALAEELCRASQMDRDLQFKEEQARRKVKSLESELESTQCVTYEAERAMRFELSALKEQVTEVSKKLLAEEDDNNSIKIELDQYRQEKANIIEDLDGCKDMCDSRMKARMDTLNQKREQLKELKDRVMDCQCKLPLDVAVEVKRTPSLAALCRCTPEDKLLESCSCTSLRSQLLSNLLSDLFGGLQAELGTSGVMMPCALLLCLDDRHNWDRASAVKTSLRNFFAQLLVGELDIAIATSIEKYHAKWVGATCADKAKLIPDPGEEVTEGWEQRAIERRAQKLATKMAEQLFEERAEELKQKAKNIVTSGPPPCECKGNQPAVYSCLVKAPTSNNAHKSGEVAPSYMRRTMQDVTHLKHQIEDLKKDSIKKEDLRQMEEKIAKIIQRAAKVDNSPTTSKNIKCIKHNQELIDLKSKNCDENSKTNETLKRKEADICNLKKYVKKSSNNQLGRIDKTSNKMFKKLEQSFAVNLCLCSGQEAPTKLSQDIQRSNNFKPLRQPQLLENLVTDISKQSKPINNLEIKEESNQLSKLSTKTVCPSDCICFHKIPSNTSIDKLLETLSKWNGSLNKILEDTKFSCDQTENENKSLNSAVISLENNKKGQDESSIPVHQTAMSNKPNKEGYNKDASYENALPPTTESEYLGAINLDKSNYNICKCPVNNNTNIMYGDGKTPDNVPFHCINADVCECKSSILNKQFQDPGYYEHVPSKIKKISHAYSVELEKPKFKCTETETDSLNKNNSTKSVGISEDTFIHDVVRKSQLFPNNCDYFVKFLGVTLTNSSSPNKTKQSYDNNSLHDPSKLPNDKENMIQQVFSNIKLNYTKSSLLPSLENCENKKLERESFDHITEKDKIPSEVLDMHKDVCVCCNKKETSKDLELNAFNLLQEHIKKKLEEFLRSSCKFSSLPPEEENKLFSTILFKVKEVISESTKDLSCKCCEESANEGSWSRAYGMLQEYLKVKIKRVHCSCVSSDGNVESILPAIMEKVCDLIENDFQRLKEKLKGDKDDNANSDKLNTTSLANFCNTENFTRTNNEIATKNDDYILLQRTSCMSLDQSGDVLGSMILSTSEKKVSCEFKIYGTDCHCQQAFSKSPDLGKDYIVSQCTDVCNEVKHSIESSSKIMTSKESNEENVCFVDCIETKPELKAKIPYIGYTLSCKSLVQNDTDKIDIMWRSLIDETRARKCSYIMHKEVTKEKSENNICNMNEPCSSNIRSESCRKNINDTEVSTLDNDADLVLKYSNDKDDIRTFDETSAGTKNTNIDDSSSTHECGLQQFIDDNTYEIDKYNTKFLYDSLHLPTATDYLTKPVKIGKMDIDNRDELEKDKCDCKMVPICHVKMLVNSIEKKLIESKCTCDSLNSQVCPVHNSYALGNID